MHTYSLQSFTKKIITLIWNILKKKKNGTSKMHFSKKGCNWNKKNNKKLWKLERYKQGKVEDY